MNFVIKLILALIWVQHQTYAQTVMRFQSHISTHARCLGDLILISNERSELMQLPLDNHPKAGALITKDQIIQWLSYKTRALDYQWKGKNTALVQQNIQTTGAALLNNATKALENHLKKKYASITLSAQGTVKDSEFPLSDFHAEIPSAYPPAKHVCVHLNRAKASIPVWFKVSAYQSVLVARHPIKNRTPLKKSDFILSLRNVAGLKANPLTQIPPSHWLKKAIHKDHILIASDIMNSPAVIKGHWVQITVQNKGISLVSKALAQNDAFIGQTARMKNPESNKYFVARVTAPNQAEISS
jgi:flagella basal body P-ring formation protein FlgA